MIALKQFIVKGVAALSLFCIATLVEAVPVTNNSDLVIAGSLRQAVLTINTNPDPAVNEITFTPPLTINLLSGLLSFTTPKPTVTIFGLPGVKIHQNNDPNNVIFSATTTNLHLVGNNAGTDSNWYGGIESGGGSIILEQQTSSTYLGVISGGADLVCQGTGQTLTFSQASTYTGSTSIEGLTLKTATANALPIGRSVNITNVGFNPGRLEIGDGLTQTLAGLTGFSGDSFVDIDNGSTLEIASDIADSTFGGVIDGPGRLVKQGAGVFTLSNSNTYTGSTTILEGTLKANALNALPQASPVTVSDNGALEIADNISQTLQSISGSGGILIDDAATLTVATVADGNFAGNITTVDSGTFVKDGTNTLTLSGTNTGNLQLADAAGGIKIPTGGSWDGPVTIGAATLEMNGGTVTQAITGNEATTSILNVTGAFTTIAAITNVGSINVAAGQTLTVNTPITEYTGLTVADTGSVVLNNNGNLSNGITLGKSTFTFNGGSYSGNVVGAAGSTMNVNSTLTPPGTITNVSTININAPMDQAFTVNNPITGYAALNITNGAAVVLNNGGSLSNGITLGNGIFTFNDGNYNGDIIGTAGSTMNVNSALTPPGAITNVSTININAQGGQQFTVNNPIVGYSALNVANGGKIVLNNNGSLSNGLTLANSVFTFNGGSYSGNVVGAAGSTMNVNSRLTSPGTITNVSTININAPMGQAFTVNNPMMGYVALNITNGAEVILNNNGSLSNGITLGNGTFTFNGGSYSGDVVGAGGSIMNVNSTLTAPGAITADTLNINPGGVFTPSVNVTTNVGLNVLQNGTLLLTNDLGGGAAVDNAGTITHTANATRTIAGNFTQEQSGILNIGITNAAQYSQFQVNGNTILNGGVMNVQLLSGAQITNGTVFDIITSTGGIAGGAVLPTVPKASLFFGFRPVVNGDKLQLIADRSGCMCVNSIPPLNGIAKKMDDLSQNDIFQPVLDILTQQTSQQAFEQKLEQLAPHGLKSEHIAIAQVLGAENRVLQRLDTLRMVNTGGVLASTNYANTGYAAGDIMDAEGSYAPIVFGNSTKQSMIEGLSGYKAITAGFGLLGDMPVLEHFRAGLGLSYANSVVRQSNNTGSHTTIGSTQGMAYGSATYGRLFLDAVLSAGINNYHGKRNITFMGQTATARYRGSQYGTKVKTGVAIPCYRVEISPTAAVQYMHLNVGQSTEQGAGISNQQLSAIRADTVRINLGGKIADNNPETKIFPEFHAFYINDVKNPQVIITSQFVEGGGSFDSTSVVPPKHGVNLGASVTALISDDFTLSGGYDLEKKKSFASHSASLKFKFLF